MPVDHSNYTGTSGPILTLFPRNKPPFPDGISHRNIDPELLREDLRKAHDAGIGLVRTTRRREVEADRELLQEMSIEHWYDLLTREEPVTQQERDFLASMKGKLQPFNYGNFTELRVWKALDDLFRQGSLSDYSTYAKVPLHKEKALKREYAFNIDLDDIGFDALAAKPNPNGEGYVLNPIQVKSCAEGTEDAIEKHTEIPRQFVLRPEQIDYLVEQFPDLGKGYFAKVPEKGYNKVCAARMVFTTNPNVVNAEAKTLDDLRREVDKSFEDPSSKLIVSKRPLRELTKLRMIKLLIQNNMLVPVPIREDLGDIEHFSDKDRPKKIRRLDAHRKESAGQRRRRVAKERTLRKVQLPAATLEKVG